MASAPPTVVLPTIPVECPSCLRQLRMVAGSAGRLVRCPVCRGMVNVPGEGVTPADVRSEDPTVSLRPVTKPGSTEPPSNLPSLFPSALPLRRLA